MGLFGGTLNAMTIANVPPNLPTITWAATLDPGYHSFPKWAINVPHMYLGFVSQEPAVQGGLNRAPGAPVVKATPSVLPVTSVQKLLHLAEVEGLRVQFTDYPKVTGTFFVNCNGLTE